MMSDGLGFSRRRLLEVTTVVGAGALVSGACAAGSSQPNPELSTEPAEGGDSVLGTEDGVALRRVVFRAPDGVELVGHLRVPAEAGGPLPAVLLSNAMTSVKEQSVQTGYAHGLARAGFVTLTFDQRRFGESGGEPRQHEDNEDRLSDLQVAVSYLTGLTDQVLPERIAAFGVSIGGGLAMRLCAIDPRVQAFVAIAAGLTDPQRIRQLFTPDAYASALAAQTSALERYHRTGELDYLPIVRVEGVPAEQPVLFDSPIAIEYYGSARGAVPQWENRATALSLRTILVRDTRHAADLVGPRAGMLAVGTADVSTFPEDHQAVHDRLTGPRRLLLVEGATHNDLYDNPRYVQQVVDEAAAFLQANFA
ncbi:alpha/beta hydrolase [Pseudonocardia kunmingensis]|uniref:Serine aminopeptidase S33 domain-containing protein n=1 Tax=Pseudonocardia kunmingensis TaxID=630975 RepID=A0A543DQ39_9PSEU|nr:alpha/beta hydrolase [Pseudonocardia kunmingensis]TQM11462.1 hypothetical protein FB558_4025 [Pseudonocardia kunmingensis]